MTGVRAFGAALLTLVLVIAACGGGTGAQPQQGPAQKGGELTVALAEDPDALDPTTARTFVGRIVFANLCEKLYDTNDKLEVVPQLATELPKLSDGGKTVTIPLREGVKFNDGTPFDADAVKQSIDRHIELKGSFRASELSPVSKVTAVDEKTIELTLSSAFAPLPGILADRAGMVMSPKQLDALGEKFGDEPVCVGPFEFEKRTASDRIDLKKASDYYDADKVNLDKLAFRIITDGNVRASNVRSGDVDVAERLDPTDATTLKGDPNLALQSPTEIGYQSVTVNVGNKNGVGEPYETLDTPLAREQTLREAFELSLDRNTINKVVFQGQFVPSCSAISPASPFAEQGLKCPPRDLAKAKQLIADSGEKTPIPVELMVENDPINERLGEIIQSLTKESGFDVKVRPTEFTAALDKQDAGEYDTFQIGWSGRLDPDGNIYPFHHTKGSQNTNGASDPEIDKLLDDAREIDDMAKRREMYWQAMELIRERHNLIYLYHRKLFTASRQDVTGVQVFGDGLLRLKSAGRTAAEK